MVARDRPHTFAGEDRDLRFVPSDAARARALSCEQVEGFNRRGYISPVDVFDPAQATDLRIYFDGLIAAVVDADDRRNSYSINCYHLVCERLYDLALEPRILDVVQDILGPDIVSWGTHLFAKLPHDGMEVPLHQDAVYWPFTSTSTVTMWLAIDDADEENAAMHFVPRSHLADALEHDALELDGTRVLGRGVSRPERFVERYVNRLHAGQASLHSDLLLHGSDANRSDRRRTGLTIRFAASNLRVQAGWEHWIYPSLHARGEADDYWPNRSRPRGEHPDLMSQISGEFDGNPA